MPQELYEIWYAVCPTHFSEKKPLYLESWINSIPSKISDAGIVSWLPVLYCTHGDLIFALFSIAEGCGPLLLWLYMHPFASRKNEK